MNWILLLVTLFLTIPVLSSAANLPKEELAVRALYSQFLIAARLSTIRVAPTDSTQTVSASAIELSDFRTGEFAIVSNQPLDEFVTKPSGDILLTIPGTRFFNGHKVCPTVMVQGWRPFTARYRGVENVDWKAPVSALVRDHIASRFAKYVVKVSYGGKTRRYQAATLFHDISGLVSPLVIDYILDGAIVARFRLEDFAQCFAFMPETLVPRMRAPALALIESLRAAPNCQMDESTKLCCDPDSGQCGVLSSRP